MSAVMRKMIMVGRCERIYRSAVIDEDMPGFYHSYILAICRNPGMSQEWLARHLCFNKSSVTRHLSRLEKDGYVERKTSEKDKRELLVYPTEKMIQMHDKVSEATGKWDKLISDAVSEEELEIFQEILQKIVDRSLEIAYPEDDKK